MTQQRRFTKEFEEEAVRLARTSGEPRVCTMVRVLSPEKEDWTCFGKVESSQ